jgi:hypothetical protein
MHLGFDPKVVKHPPNVADLHLGRSIGLMKLWGLVGFGFVLTSCSTQIPVSPAPENSEGGGDQKTQEVKEDSPPWLHSLKRSGIFYDTFVYDSSHPEMARLLVTYKEDGRLVVVVAGGGTFVIQGSMQIPCTREEEIAAPERPLEFSFESYKTANSTDVISFAIVPEPEKIYDGIPDEVWLLVDGPDVICLVLILSQEFKRSCFYVPREAFVHAGPSGL